MLDELILGHLVACATACQNALAAELIPAVRRRIGEPRRPPGPQPCSPLCLPSDGITLDCDTLIVAADDVRIMIHTAEPETEDAERLTLAIVVGTQAICDITTHGGTTAPPSGLIRKAGLLRMQINYTHEDTRHDAAQQTVGRP
jgi:predicted outer membrane lipoprotein